MIYNKISGSTVDIANSFLFKEFNEERCYLSFLRDSDTWGNCALINISLNNVEIKDVIASTSGEDNKFTDRNVTSYGLNDTYFFIYKTNSIIPDFDNDPNNYDKIFELENTELSILYINSSWVLVKGLPIDYANYINNNNSEKFYLIRNNIPVYSNSPDNVIAIAKINNRSTFDYSVYNEPAVLKAYNSGLEISAIYGLNKSTNILGEVDVNGLIQSNIVITEEILINDYAINGDVPITNTTPYFILRHAINQNNIIFNKMYLMKTQDEEGVEGIWHINTNTHERYLLFKANNTFQNNFYIKITEGNGSTGIGIYHESLPYTFNIINNPNIISDANPPGLDSTYLKNPQIHESLFGVKGLVQIKKSQLLDDATSLYSKVSFVRELKNQIEKTKYEEFGFTVSTNPKRIEEVQITSDENVIHFGNIRRNPKTVNGDYLQNSSRLYLYTNHFVIGDTITIRYWNDSHTEYNPYENQTVNANQQSLTIIGISYQEDNYYIDLNGSTNRQITFSANTPDVEAQSDEFASIISAPTNIIVRVQYAVCDSYEDALRYHMNSVMIEMKIPNESTGLYSGIYRQIAICHQPKYNNGGIMTPCTDQYYNENLFDSENHKYNLGTTLFLANKTPIYRQYLQDKEVFKLIL